MNGTFNPTYSTNDIWWDEEMDQCLTPILETMQSNVATLGTSKADATHNHSNYALVDHAHTGYASADHSHDAYAVSDHTHSNKADLVNGVVPSSQMPNNIVTLEKLANIMSTHHDLTTTVTPGSNYSSVIGSATLVGNMLRVKFTANRNSAASGNIDNETVATFSIAHGGKIKGGYAVTFCNGTSGHVANMITSNVACDETNLTFRITLTATAGDTSAMNPFFAMPVIIDLAEY